MMDSIEKGRGRAHLAGTVMLPPVKSVSSITTGPSPPQAPQDDGLVLGFQLQLYVIFQNTLLRLLFPKVVNTGLQPPGDDRVDADENAWRPKC